MTSAISHYGTNGTVAPPVIDLVEPPAIELLDLSRGPTDRPRRARGGRSRILLRFIGPLALLIFWKVGSETGFISSRVIASPEKVIEAFRFLIQNGDLQKAIPTSLRRALTGLLFGATIGIVLGTLTGLWRLGEELLDSTMQMLRTIPFIALIPLFVVWFGIDERPKIVLVTVACVFPTYLNTFAGVRSVDPKLIEAARVFGVSRWALITRVILPNALPSILVGIRFAMGSSLLALVAAEQVNAGSGLGYLIMTASAEIRTDIVVAGITMYAALGIVIDLIIRLLQRLLLPWRPTHLGKR